MILFYLKKMPNEQDEVLTIKDVVANLIIIQQMKLLFLQDATFDGKDVYIHHIVNRSALLKLLRDKKYRKHYKNFFINNDGSITIHRLNKLSFLWVGLKKEILRFMEPYFLTSP